MRRKLTAVSLALCAGVLAPACNDLLVEDPKGFTTTDTFYQTGADLNSATIAIYNSLRGLQGTGAWSNLELASDQARAEAARLFVTGQNLWVSTDYSGFDPDVNSSGGDARIGGVDVGAYPRQRAWNVGVNVTF